MHSSTGASGNPVNSIATTGSTTHMESMATEKEALAALESRLKDLTQLRDQMQTKLKDSQKELQRLLDKKTERPRESMEELDNRIAQLERDRTIKSMPLAEEKAILKEIHKAERIKRAVQDVRAHDDRIKAKKARVAELRSSLQIMRQDIDLLRAEVSLTKTAVQIGCTKESLLGMKVSCPEDKIGDIIGKKGANVKQLMEKASVRVDIVNNDIRLLGAMENLDVAAVDLTKVILAKEEECDLQPTIAKYLSGRKIQQLQLLQVKHPSVHMHLPRLQAKLILRGSAEDIERVKQDLSALQVADKQFTVSNPEAAYIIGKRGATIERLTEQHQVVIQVGQKTEEGSTIEIIGLEEHVDAALSEIFELAADAREGAETVPIESTTRSVLLKNHGVVMKRIFKEANKEAHSVGGAVSLRIDGNSIVVRAKAKVLQAAKVAVQAQVDKIEEMAVKMTVEKTILPKIIGKGGEVLKTLTDGTAVDIEVDRAEGVLAIIGTDPEATQKVKSSIEVIIGQNQILRIPVESTVYKRQLTNLLRSKGEEVRALPCSIRGIDEEKSILLRGETDKIEAAAAIVKEFLQNNHMEDVTLSIEDLRLLSRGGSDCKLVEFETLHDVKINSSWKDHILYVQGQPSKVTNAVQAINTYLFGGDSWCVLKVPLDDRSVAIVIGKGGKHLKTLREQFKDVSIIVTSDDSIVLRGPKEMTELCRSEILKRVYAAQITQEVDVTEEHLAKLKKGRFIRDIMRDIPVLITLNDDIAAIRGVLSDVEYVVALLNEYLYGFFESRIVLAAANFSKIKDSFEKRSVIDGIKSSSGAFVALSGAEEALIIRGKREQVQAAKKELLRLFDFLLKPGYEQIALPRPLAYNIAKGSSIAEISATTGATVIVDRDIASALVFANDPEKLERAVAMLNSRIDEASQCYFETQLNEEDKWIAASLIGNKGSRINNLRKETKCSIVIDTSEGRITVVSKDGADTLSAARCMIEAMIHNEREKCARITVPASELSYFIGKKGQSIKEFRKKHEVEIEIVRDNEVVLKGEPEAVAQAKVAVEEFIKEREGVREKARREEEEALSIHLRRDEVPGVIGKKGEVINALVKEYGVKIDVDRQLSIVTIRRGDADARDACASKIRALVEARNSDGGENKESKPENLGSSPQQVKKDSKVAAAPAFCEATTFSVSSQSIEGAYFPPLNDSSGRVLATELMPGRSWAQLATMESKEDDEVPSTEIETVQEAILTH